MLSLSDLDRSKLAELMGAETLPYYEARVQAYIDTRTDEDGKLHGPPAKWKNLAAAIRAIWISDRRKQGSGMPIASKAVETQEQKLDRAKAIWMIKVRERNSWLIDSKLHHHDAECQGGNCCRYAEGKEPVLPSLSQVLEKLENKP